MKCLRCKGIHFIDYRGRSDEPLQDDVEKAHRIPIKDSAGVVRAYKSHCPVCSFAASASVYVPGSAVSVRALRKYANEGIPVTKIRERIKRWTGYDIPERMIERVLAA